MNLLVNRLSTDARSVNDSQPLPKPAFFLRRPLQNVERIVRNFLSFLTPPELAVLINETLSQFDELEAALQSGRLSAELLRTYADGPLLDAYRQRLMLQNSRALDARRHFAMVLRSRMSVALRQSVRVTSGDSSRIKLSTVELRSDQIYSSFFWGTEFNFPAKTTLRRYREAIRESHEVELAAAVRGLAAIEKHFTKRPFIAGQMPYLEGLGHSFERLMLDILNEHQDCARLAPFHEDILEKTDIRVRYPDLKRQRGARVQVKLVGIASFQKVLTAAMHRIDEFVVLTPLTLAEYFYETYSERSAEENEAIWAALKSCPTTTEELGNEFLHLFLDALQQSTPPPEGPAWLVPEALRVIIRQFVRERSFESTRRMRVRLAANA